MTVWAVHELRHDTAPADRFGQLVTINHRYVFGDELVQDHTMTNDWTIPPNYRSNLENAARSFDPDLDYMLIAGDHLQLIAFAALLFSQHNSIMVLRYDRKLGEYIPVRLNSGLLR